MTIFEGNTQSFDEACRRFRDWLDLRVLAEGRGDDTDQLDVDPSATFWLGRLASEEEVRSSDIGERAERLDPCAIGIRLRPAVPAPWRFRVNVSLVAWIRVDAKDAGLPWAKTEPIDTSVDVDIPPGSKAISFGKSSLKEKLAAAGADGLSAEIRVEVEEWHGLPELVVQLINTSPERHAALKDTHLYQTTVEVSGLDTKEFQLEALPDSFRYNRAVAAYGINVGVERTVTGFRTTDTVTVDTFRPVYWSSDKEQPDLSFSALEQNPLPSLTALVEAFDSWTAEAWSEARLAVLASDQRWSAEMKAHADAERRAALDEVGRLRRGLKLLTGNKQLRMAFQLMNQAIGYSSAGKYTSWRPFQVGFLLSAVSFVLEPGQEADIVDTVWFATGGGKTETYLGLLVTAAFHDRLTGKNTGITAWSRFPLRLLSLQQTQRFADALAGAERVRRAHKISGAPFSLGFLVGAKGTPNRILKEADGDYLDPDSSGMPDRYQVLLHCPFCHQDSITMRFDRRYWRLAHECTNQNCPWPERSLPFYIVDDEIYRFLPTVVLGTLDKAASIALQPAMRGLMGPPLGLCSEQMHGYTYAPRANRPNGCLVPDCPGHRKPLTMTANRFAPSLRLQDELHLLRDSLGAVDSHYESLLDHLQDELSDSRAKVVASSATLTGHDRQVEVLYRRTGRVFPLQGPTAGESFWTRRSTAPLRRFVAVAPRGVTLEHVSDRTISVLQQGVRILADNPNQICDEAKITRQHLSALLDVYGTDVIYGTSLYDVEAAERSLANNVTVDHINSEQLTGQTDFDDVRVILDRLEHPESEFLDRIHVIAASSMLSHGVDIARLNTMVMLGLPLGTAEFIQTSARVGRTYPGLVYVLHKIGRERDAQTFRHFEQYVTHGDRFIEPIPITRRSRRVLRLTLPGVIEARRLNLMEPASGGQRLTTVKALRKYAADIGLSPSAEAETIARLLGFEGPSDELLREEIRIWLQTWFNNLEDPATTAKWPNRLGPSNPMRSLRDVEASAPIHE
jgi:hypothetical protein